MLEARPHLQSIQERKTMPAYEYLCDACACRFEKRQKMSDAALVHCPECGGHVKRLISGGAGAITKGSSHHHADAPPPCASGGPCCGGQGACAPGMFCEN
jgi:putative FmdB family regulatory protein